MRWREYSIADKEGFKESFKDHYSDLNMVAFDASVVKIKLLTAGNAVGLLTVVTYFGVITSKLDVFIIISVLAFLMGILFNGIAIFKAETRQKDYRDNVLTDKQAFANIESDMDDTQYLEITERHHKSYLDKTKTEGHFEYASGACFFIGGLFIVLGMCYFIMNNTT